MIDRFSILGHYLAARLNFKRWKSRRDLEAWQNARVAGHLRKALPGSRYYRDHFAGRDLSQWRDLPISTKSQLMAAFDDWNTAGITLSEAGEIAEAAERSRDFSPKIREYTVGMSSGTTGSRGIFLVSPAERRRWAGTLLARTLRGTLHLKHRAALFLRADSPLYQTVGSRHFSFTFFDLFTPLEEHGPRLRSLHPTLLAAPPTALVRLAAQPGAADLLAPPGILLSVADVLDDSDRAIIESGFGRPVGQIYQATEGFLAATCPEGSLHWNEDAISVQKEWIDAARTRYHPVITDFRRTTQPILRFRLDDVIVDSTATACPCGSVFGILGSVEGRQDDVLSLPSTSGEGCVRVFPDFVRRALILALPPGIDYTVTQTSMGAWDVALADLSLGPAVGIEIDRLCRDLQARSPALSFTPWTTPHPGAKRRRVRRAMPMP